MGGGGGNLLCCQHFVLKKGDTGERNLQPLKYGTFKRNPSVEGRIAQCQKPHTIDTTHLTFIGPCIIVITEE